MKFVNLFVICLFISGSILGQEITKLNKITLQSGEVFVGEVLLKNQEILLIKTESGSRFQFPISEIKAIEEFNMKSNEKAFDNNNEIVETSLVCGLFEINTGLSTAKNKYQHAISNQLSLSFGTRKIRNKDIFAGLGLAYFNVFMNSEDLNISFIPVFLKFKSNLTDKKTSPFFGLDAGYAITINDKHSGGLYSKLYGGISRKLNYKTSLFLGLSANVISFDSNLTETNALGAFHYYGNTSMLNIGLNLGLQF